MPETNKKVTGSKHGKWKGGSKSTDGYQSRKAWEKCHGKKVPAGMIVHHKDGNPENRSCSNLILITRAKSNRIHKKGKSIEQQSKGIKTKPNIGTEDGVQRRFRRGKS